MNAAVVTLLALVGEQPALPYYCFHKVVSATRREQ